MVGLFDVESIEKTMVLVARKCFGKHIGKVIRRGNLLHGDCSRA